MSYPDAEKPRGESQTLSKTVSIPKQGSGLNLREEPMRKEEGKGT